MISPIMIHYPYRENWCVQRALATTLRRCVVLSRAPCDARRPIATHHPAVPSPLFPSVTHFPSFLLSAARLRPGATNATLAVVAVHGLDVRAQPSSASQLIPSALVRTAADLLSDAHGQPRRTVPTMVGRSNKCCTPAIPKSSETRCDEPLRALKTTRNCGSDLLPRHANLTSVCYQRMSCLLLSFRLVALAPREPTLGFALSETMYVLCGRAVPLAVATGDLSRDHARRQELQNVPGLARALAVRAAAFPLRRRRFLAPSRLHPQPCHLPLFPAVGGI